VEKETTVKTNLIEDSQTCVIRDWESSLRILQGTKNFKQPVKAEDNKPLNHEKMDIRSIILAGVLRRTFGRISH
jgi:hypothetical protein